VEKVARVIGTSSVFESTISSPETSGLAGVGIGVGLGVTAAEATERRKAGDDDAELGVEISLGVLTCALIGEFDCSCTGIADSALSPSSKDKGSSFDGRDGSEDSLSELDLPDRDADER